MRQVIRRGAWRLVLCLVPLVGTTSVVWAADSEADPPSAQSTSVAQAPVQTPSPPPLGEDSTGGSPARDDEGAFDEEDSKPWWRLIIFIPVSALIGVGAAIARRAFSFKGLISD